MKEYTICIKKRVDSSYHCFECPVLEKDGSSVSNPMNHYDTKLDQSYENLTLAAQKNVRDGDGAEWYGFEVRYMNCYVVNAGAALRMHKTLLRINKKLDEFNETRGRCLCFASFAGRVAEIIKADFCDIGEGGSYYCDKNITFYTLPEGIEYIRTVQQKG